MQRIIAQNVTTLKKDYYFQVHLQNVLAKSDGMILELNSVRNVIIPGKK